MPNIKNHLDSNENIVLFFRPSRKAYLFQYFVFIVLLAASLGLVYYSYFNLWQIIAYYSNIFFILGAIIALYALIMLIRLEYRIWSRRYALTDERILYSVGVFSEQFKSLMYSYITDISLTQTLWDKIVNTGTLKINTAGSGGYEIRYRKVSEPYAIKKEINDLMPMKV